MADDTAVRTEAGQKLLKWLEWVARDDPRDAREYALQIAAVERAAEAWGTLRAMEATPLFAQPAPDALRAAAQAALDLLKDLSVAYHQTGSIRDHADPKDRTGWNVHGIETCDDPYCTEGLAAIAALRAALGDER